MDDSTPYSEEGIFVSGADGSKLAHNSDYFAALRDYSNQKTL